MFIREIDLRPLNLHLKINSTIYNNCSPVKIPKPAFPFFTYRIKQIIDPQLQFGHTQFFLAIEVLMIQSTLSLYIGKNCLQDSFLIQKTISRLNNLFLDGFNNSNDLQFYHYVLSRITFYRGMSFNQNYETTFFLPTYHTNLVFQFFF